MKHMASSILVKHANSLSLWTVCILETIIVESFFLAQFFWCERYMIIKIEIIIIRRNPLKIPTHTLLVFPYFAIRCFRNCYHGNISLIQMDNYSIKIVGPKRTRRTSCVPVRIIHKVIYN